MPVPLEPLAGNAGLVNEDVHEALHGAGQGGAGIGHAVAHGVAEADFDGHAGLAGELHELGREGQAEAVDIRAGDVLEVAAGDNAPLQGLGDQVHVHVKGLFARFAELQEDVVVGNAGEHADFGKFHVPRELEIVLVGADPSRDAREAVAAGAACVDAFPVTLGVHEKFRGRDEAGFSAEPVQEIEDFRHLADSVGRTGLLAVAERGIRDAELIGRMRREHHVIEFGAADARVRKLLTEELGFLNVLKRQAAVMRRVL